MFIKLGSKARRKVAMVASLSALTILIGHGCSKMSANNNSASSSGGAPLGTSGGTGAGSGFTPVPGAATVSLIYNKQIMDNMVGCTGIGSPSAATLAEWSNRQSSFSEYGYATDVTAPMLMAITALSGEICNDLLSAEAPLPQASRRIFNSVDFTAGPGSFQAAQVADVARRIARSCWARNEEVDELGIINEEATAALSGVSMTDSQQTKNLSLMVCTGMLASLSGITL